MHSNKYINEKYSLQEYEGKIRDAIIDEIKALNKISPIVCLFLYKYGVFTTVRTINDHELNCSITLIYYDVDGSKPSERIGDSAISPGEVDGATAGDRVFVYVPVSLEKAPFGNKGLNSTFEEICDDYTDNLNKDDSIITVKDYKSISDSTNKLKQKYDYLFDEMLDELPESASSAKKTLNIDVVYTLKTLLHELTHASDQTTASRVNHFSGLGIDDVDDYGLELALNILYSLWSRTEFNAFTQTFGRDIEKQRAIVKSDYINKVSMKYLSRTCSDGGNISLEDFAEDTYEALDELSDSEYDDEFWDVIKTIAADGSRDSSAKERFAKMTPKRFRNYFIRTSIKILEKLKDKVIKNVAAQNSYDRDISNIASEIKNACSQHDYSEPFDIDFNFNCYFKILQASYKVYANIETIDDIELTDKQISNNSMIHLTVSQLNVGCDLTPRQIFGKDDNSYSELYRELMTKRRKTALDKLYINFAEDLNSALNRMIKK
jgi:hypothetical protein